MSIPHLLLSLCQEGGVNSCTSLRKGRSRHFQRAGSRGGQHGDSEAGTLSVRGFEAQVSPAQPCTMFEEALRQVQERKPPIRGPTDDYILTQPINQLLLGPNLHELMTKTNPL